MVARFADDGIRSVDDHEGVRKEQAFIRAVEVGLADIEAGREVSLAEVKAKFGLG